MFKNKKFGNWLMVFSIPIALCLQALFRISMRFGIADGIPLYMKQFVYAIFFNFLFPLVLVTILGLIFLVKGYISKKHNGTFVDSNVFKKAKMSIMGVVNRIVIVLLMLSLIALSIQGSIKQYNVFYGSNMGDISLQEGNYSEAFEYYNLAILSYGESPYPAQLLIGAAIANYMQGKTGFADATLRMIVEMGGDVKTSYEMFLEHNQEYLSKQELDVINKYIIKFSGIEKGGNIAIEEQIDSTVEITGYDKSVILEQGNSIYDIARIDILSVLPNDLKIDIEKLFVEFDNANLDEELGLSENDVRKSILNKILILISQKITTDHENQRSGEITKDDMTLIIIPDICRIMEYYAISNDVCSLEFSE